MTATLTAPAAPTAPEVDLTRTGPPAGWRPPPGVRPREPRAPRPPLTDGAAGVMAALVALVVLAASIVGYLAVLTPLQETRAQRVLEAQLRAQLAAQTAPLGGLIEPGTPVALLEIPTLGLHQVVVEGTAAEDLMAGPGHRRDTVLPGQEGVSLVYGRSGAYGGPFRAAPSLMEGDGIVVTTAQGQFTYRVDDVRRAGDPVPTAPAAGGSRLTLVTGEGPGGSAGTFLPVRVVYVDATLVGEAAVGPGGRVGAIPDTEKAMRVDTSVWPALVLALQLLLVLVVATAYAARRLPHRAVWVLAVPLLAATGWMVADVASRLLPNLL